MEASCDEKAALRTRCGPSVERWRAQQNHSRYKRGLVISWRTRIGAPPPEWGIGKLLLLAYRLHTLCLERWRRYCYLSLYDSALDAYFGYHGGSSASAVERWSPIPRELARYPAPHVELTINHSWKDHRFVENTLVPTLLDHDDVSLVVVHIFGVFLHGFLGLPAEQAAKPIPPSTATLGRLPYDPCLCRYVPEPLESAHLATRGAPIAIHLRTGYADASARAIRRQPSRAEATARWVRAACGTDSPLRFAAEVGVPQLVITDSPGLLRHLAARHPTILRPGSALNGSKCDSHARSGRRGTSTSVGHRMSRPSPWPSRSWGTCWQIKRDALDDIVAASQAHTLYMVPQRQARRQPSAWRLSTLRPKQASKPTPKQASPSAAAAHLSTGSFGELHWSGFAWPVLQRSLCLKTARAALPGCPHYAETFIRDLPVWLGAPAEEFTLLQTRALGQPLAGRDHPCRWGNASACHADWLAALN